MSVCRRDIVFVGWLDAPKAVPAREVVYAPVVEGEGSMIVEGGIEV